jgi:hypothetical protein
MPDARPDVQALREAIERATPAPWAAFGNKYGEHHVSLPMAGSTMKLALSPTGLQSSNPEADARAIALLRNETPALLDYLEALEALATDLLYAYIDASSEDMDLVQRADRLLPPEADDGR